MRGPDELIGVRMFGFLKQEAWFEGFSDQCVVYTRWTHDEEPSDSYPVVILFDPKAEQRARLRKLTTIGVITVEFSSAAIVQDKMPAGAVVLSVKASVDATFEARCAQANLKANLLATQTGGGARHYFVLLESVEKLRAALAGLELPPEANLNVWERGDLPALLGWLAPSRLESWALRDDAVRAALTERGDDGVPPRDTRFFFYGGDLLALAEAASKIGFKTEAQGEPTVISKDMPVTADEMSTLNGIFSEWVDAFGVEYDGWEAAIVAKN